MRNYPFNPLHAPVPLLIPVQQALGYKQVSEQTLVEDRYN